MNYDCVLLNGRNVIPGEDDQNENINDDIIT